MTLVTPSAPHHFAASGHSSASAPAKLILCGEHAVVYGRPAIALPLAGIRAHADIVDGRAGSGIAVYARDLNRRWRVADDPHGPLSDLIRSTLAILEPQVAHVSNRPLIQSLALRITITSQIPIASGMGSGAAVATAVVRALARHLGAQLSPAEISALVYTSEQRFHGTPSGIDNTVIAYEQPIWFQRTNDEGGATNDESANSSSVPRPSSGTPPSRVSHRPAIQPIVIAAPFTLLIGDTGIRSATRLSVGEVRARQQADPARYRALFDQVGALVARVRAALAQGDMAALGPLLNQNHALLQQIGVSSPELDALVGAAQSAGALGAKLSGAGWGGVMLALVTTDTCHQVRAALEQAGPKRVIETAVNQSLPEPAT
ncbi:MAG TPA: mevalonate kinase [Roseiflexaceae bacterium]|nr:mevalonate kinase [Roseiflexaceae bacterium]